MRRTSLSLILALAMVAGACGDDSPRVVGLDDLRLHKVAGDNQAAPVASTAPSTVIVPAGLSAQVSTGPGDLFDQVLVVRLAEEGKMTMSGATVKPGTMIHWEVRGDGCGKPVGGSTAVDDTAYSINRWRKGTKAGECHMDACRILADGSVECDQTFVAVQEPGDLYRFQIQRVDDQDEVLPFYVEPGAQYDLRRTVYLASDRHLNPIPLDRVRSLPESVVSWQIVATDTTVGTGWTLTIPPANTSGAHCWRNPPNQFTPNPPLECRSVIWISLEGVISSTSLEARTMHP